MDILQDVTQIQEEEGGIARAFQRLSSVDVNVVHVGQIHAEDVVASTQQAPQYAFMVRIASTGRVCEFSHLRALQHVLFGFTLLDAVRVSWSAGTYCDARTLSTLVTR